LDGFSSHFVRRYFQQFSEVYMWIEDNHTIKLEVFHNFMLDSGVEMIGYLIIVCF